MSLRSVQVAISNWVRAPEGVAAAIAAEDQGAGGNESRSGADRLADLIRSDESLDATRRLEIYANAYFTRILGVLRSDYPALLAALGDQSFYDLITSYLLVEPSRHASLRYAGMRLADFLSAHEAALGIRTRSPWASDLAAFEWARIDAFDVADGVSLSSEALASVSPTAFGALDLSLGAWAYVRGYDYPVDRIWRLGLDGKTPAESDLLGGEVKMLIWRKDEKVFHRRLDGLEESALALISLGSRFDALCEWTACEIGEDEAPTQAASWLRQWLGDGLLAASKGRMRREAGLFSPSSHTARPGLKRSMLQS